MLRLSWLALLMGCNETGDTENPADETAPPEGQPVEPAPKPGPGKTANLFFQPIPLVIAHAGGSRLGPDHTLGTYQLGLDAGTDVLELDVHTTSDDEVVVIHDATIDRTTDGSGAVQGFTLAEIQAFDAAYDWSPDGGATYPERGKGHVIPAMKEVFAAFPNEWYVIEIKQANPPMVDTFIEVLDEYDMRDRVIVASFNDQVIAEVREKAPNVLTSFGEQEATVFRFLTPSDIDTYEPPAQVLQLPTSALGGTIEVISDGLLANAEHFGIPVHAWTINDRDEMDTLLSRGVNGLITDWPDRARAAVDALPE